MTKPGHWCKSYYWINTTTGFVAASSSSEKGCDPVTPLEKCLKFRLCVVPKRLQEEDEEQDVNMFFQNNVKNVNIRLM